MDSKRYLTNNELIEIRFKEDMLKGNINRMCVCNDTDELFNMYYSACLRLLELYNICRNRFLESEE